MTYAKNTSVSVENSRIEIERIVAKYGAKAYQYGYNETRAKIEFMIGTRLVRFLLPLPTQAEISKRNNGRPGRPKQLDQVTRERWRALALCIKAKLEAVESGIAEFDEEFLAQVVDPQSGRTVYELISPRLVAAYSGSKEPLLGLPAPG